MEKSEIKFCLRTTDEDNLEKLFKVADCLRGQYVGDQVHLRALVEISNFCRRGCAYCGLRSGNRAVRRYRMSDAEILDCAIKAARLGYGTVVLQAGEDPVLSEKRIANLVRRIVGETGLAVALSLGERTTDELAAWREAGATRYLLRFETSDEHLFRAIHPMRPGQTGRHPRIELLREISQLDYETGSGVMVGIPGQSYSTLADDLLSFSALGLDMIGVGPWVPHPATPLADTLPTASPMQVPHSPSMTLRVIALARIICPGANIPATTALATVGGDEFMERALRCGANVIMPDMTPARYRADYCIYPGKHGFYQDTDRQDEMLKTKISALGLRPGAGPGSSPSWLARRDTGKMRAMGGVL